mmetsp:Transcript_41826/g.76671  ORF Transcript_41826/g.76671 Transcript_41826/m.76671 type:complete len:82 (+) Transcript_41826:130-375(+)
MAAAVVNAGHKKLIENQMCCTKQRHWNCTAEPEASPSVFLLTPPGAVLAFPPDLGPCPAWCEPPLRGPPRECRASLSSLND